MDNNMSYDTEIDLLSLLAYLVRRWKSIVAAMLVFAILLAGFKMLTGDSPEVSPDTAAKYEHSLQDYEHKKQILESSIAATKQHMSDLNNAFGNSVLFHIDPSACPQASSTLVIQAEENSASLLSAFAAHVYSADYSSLESDLGLRTGEIYDLIFCTPNIEGNTLEIVCCYTELEGAKAILDEVLSAVKAFSADIEKALGVHQLLAVTEASSISTCDYVADIHYAWYDTYTKENSVLTSSENTLKALAAPSSPYASGMSVPLFAVIGALLGAFLIAAYHCVVYIFAAKVRTDADIQNVTHAPLMAIYGNGIKERGFGKLAAAIEGSKYRADAAYTTAKAAAFLRALDTEYKEVLVLGLEAEEKIEMLKSQLGSAATERSISFCPAGIDGAAEIQLVENADAVIIAAERNISRMRAVHQKAELSRMTDKPVVGCVLV